MEGGEWDVVIARPIHHAVPAGMRWGQSRTTQLQPVLVCCARLRRVPTAFCCLLLDSLCSSSLLPPVARVPSSALLRPVLLSGTFRFLFLLLLLVL